MSKICDSGSVQTLHIHVTNPTANAWKYHLVVLFNYQTDSEYDISLDAGAYKDIDVQLQMPEVSETKSLPVQIFAFETSSEPDVDLGVVASDTVTVEYIREVDYWDVTITVKDIDTDGPISGASVNITSIGVGQPAGYTNPNFDDTQNTNSSGVAVFQVPEAQYTMTVKASGYKDYTFEIGYIRPDVSFVVPMQKTSSPCQPGRKWDEVLQRCVQPVAMSVSLSVSPKVIQGGVVNQFITTVNSNRGVESEMEGTIRAYLPDGQWVVSMPIGRFTAPAVGNISVTNTWPMADNIAPSEAGTIVIRFDMDLWNVNNSEMRLGLRKSEIFTKVPPVGPVYVVDGFTFSPQNHISGILGVYVKNNSAIERNIIVGFQLIGVSISAYYNASATHYDGNSGEWSTIFQPGQRKLCQSYLANELKETFYPGVYNVQLALWDYTTYEAWPAKFDLGNVTIA